MQIAPRILDPQAEKDFVADLANQLETGEGISTFALTPVEVVVGDSTLILTVMAGDNAASKINTNTAIRMWLTVGDSIDDLTVFNGDGVVLPLLITYTTDSTPPRTDQLTLGIRVRNK